MKLNGTQKLINTYAKCKENKQSISKDEPKKKPKKKKNMNHKCTKDHNIAKKN
jgi:hypothetical protein